MDTATRKDSGSRLVLTLLVATLVLAVLIPASAETSDTISIIKDGENSLSNSEIASRLADETFTAVDRVLIGRDDEFADAMTSGLLQADSPLLLVPSGGPVPQRVLDQLQIYGPSEVLLLGGPDAISDDVVQELEDAGYSVDRAFGPSRFETATEVADRGEPDPDTILIARAFADGNSGDPTQAFADALAAGGWAAENRWPILLTQTGVLTGTTRDYLAAHDVQQAFILGGTAAVSATVEQEIRGLVGDVERVSGSDRFETAVEIAGKRGADSAADAARVLLVESQDSDAWAGGFAAAAHSAAFGAPIVLASGEDLPPATVEWLSGTGATFAGVQDPPPAVLTCVTVPSVCDEARALLGLPDEVELSFSPPDGSTVQTDDLVTVSVSGEIQQLVLSGSCLAGSPVSTTANSLAVRILASDDCTLTAQAVLPGGITQDQVNAEYAVAAPPATQILLLTADSAGTGSTGALRLVGADGSNSRVVSACDGCRDLRVSSDGSRAVTVEQQAVVVRSAPDFATPVVAVPAAAGVQWDTAQFTPSGQAVVANRYDRIEDTNQVVRINPDGSVTPLTTGADLAGWDAVAATTAVSGGVGALVIRQVVGTTSSTVVQLVDVLGGDMPRQVFSTSGFVAAAALSPGGDSFVVSLPAQQQLAVGFFDQRQILLTSPTDALVVRDPVWRTATSLAGVDEGPNGPRAVVVDVGLQLTVTGGTVVANLSAPQRPGLLGGQILAAVADVLVTGDGQPIATFPGTQIRNPHRVAS